jgi:hypothetical protein
MIPADDCSVQALIGKRVAFKNDAEHAECWHFRVGLRRGTVLKRAQSLAQKAEMLRAEGGEVTNDLLEEYEDVPRVWVKADPCESFPRGCEAAIEPGCLLLLE